MRRLLEDDLGFTVVGCSVGGVLGAGADAGAEAAVESVASQRAGETTHRGWTVVSAPASQGESGTHTHQFGVTIGFPQHCNTGSSDQRCFFVF
jgi:hypothetical protein